MRIRKRLGDVVGGRLRLRIIVILAAVLALAPANTAPEDNACNA